MLLIFFVIFFYRYCYHFLPVLSIFVACEAIIIPPSFKGVNLLSILFRVGPFFAGVFIVFPHSTKDTHEFRNITIPCVATNVGQNRKFFRCEIAFLWTLSKKLLQIIPMQPFVEKSYHLFDEEKKGVRWGLEGTISSDYLAHCSHFLFHKHAHRLFGVLLYAISESCDTNFAGQVVYKPWVLSASSEALMPITAILMPAVDCVLLLHQLVIGPVTVHLM